MLEAGQKASPSLDEDIDAFLSSLEQTTSTHPRSVEEEIDTFLATLGESRSRVPATASPLNVRAVLPPMRPVASHAQRPAPPFQTRVPPPSVRDIEAQLRTDALTGRDKRSRFVRVVDAATTPLLPQVAEVGRQAADAIDTAPRQVALPSVRDVPAAIADLARGAVTHPIDTARGFVAGTGGASGVATQMTSPLDAALTLATAGSAAAATRGFKSLRQLLDRKSVV